MNFREDCYKWIVYALYSSDNPSEYRYIGITSQTLKDRLKGHYKAAKRGNWEYDKSYRAKWIRKAIRDGFKIGIIQLFQVEADCDKIAVIEQQTVNYYKFVNHRLTNTAKCEKSFWKGRKHSKESKEKMSKSSMGRVVTKEVADKTSGGKNGWATQIYQYSKSGIFIKKHECISDAYKEFGKNSQKCRNITLCARKNKKKLYKNKNSFGRYYSSMGFVWLYDKINS